MDRRKKGIKEKKSTITSTLTFNLSFRNLANAKGIKISLVVGRQYAFTGEFVIWLFCSLAGYAENGQLL
jgi:hypothetical protein